MAFAQHKATLAWPNWIDRCTLSSEAAFTRPLDRVQARVLKDRARTDETTFQITIELDKVRPCGVVALAAHNLSVDATWRIQVWSDTDGLLEDSGERLIWPGVFQSYELLWEDDNFWTGQPSAEDLERFTPLATWWFDRAWVTHRVTIDITDPGNPDGYIEIGRVVLADVWQPQYNMSYGIQWAYVDPTEVDEALDGTEHFDERPQVRTVSMAFDWLDEFEAFARMFRMRRDLGISRELLFAYRLKQDSTYIQRTMLARALESDPLTHPNAVRHAHSVALKEIL